MSDTKVKHEAGFFKDGHKSQLSSPTFGLATTLCLIFFLSGTSALVFETLWFRLAGLAFGNTLWASSIVLSSFMGGLALGNALAVIQGHRIRNPIYFYAVLELLVAFFGVLLVFLFPHLTRWLTPLFRLILPNQVLLNTFRLLISFVLMLIPATAMGMTLPLLVKALYAESPNFGRVLGRLYGYNTLGAVVGALLGETLLIKWVGIRGTGLWAGFLNLGAAGGAVLISFKFSRFKAGLNNQTGLKTRLTRIPKDSLRYLAAGFLSGGILLALEVVWFRFLSLFLIGYSLEFAILLALVLAGIALGGLLASFWCRHDPRAHLFLPPLSLLSGITLIAVYLGFDTLIELAPKKYSWYQAVYFSLPLIFPVSLLSGILFTLIGSAAQVRIDSSLKTTGYLTFFNTFGAMSGSLAAGFILLPRLGMELSFFILALAYGGVALCTANYNGPPRSRKTRSYGLAALSLLALFATLFPFGRMQDYILSVGNNYFPQPTLWRPVAISEGLTETIQYWQESWLGKPLYTRLLTNNLTMSTTQLQGRRYMNFFAYWPAALHPDPKEALLICFGVGNTAQALTDNRNLTKIDVVDISRRILEMSPIVFPEETANPLKDPRVKIHVEDGRFFLLTNNRRWDIITGEPPPPQVAGVVNLYSQEYFQLVHDRLKQGGMATYWLPVYQLEEKETLSILKAFCNVFENCSLWTAHGLEWMMVGIRQAKGPVTEEVFKRQWNDAKISFELRRVGFETPEQIGSTFLYDAADIIKMTEAALPLTDNYPKRLSGWLAEKARNRPLYLSYMDAARSRKRFMDSELIRKLWPEAIREKTLSFFKYQDLLNRELVKENIYVIHFPISTMHIFLTETQLRFPIFWIMRSDELMKVDKIPEKITEDNKGYIYNAHYHMGVQALADRDYRGADRHFAAAQKIRKTPDLVFWRPYVLCLDGRKEEAKRTIQDSRGILKTIGGSDNYIKWLDRTFNLGFGSL